ncbi:hypothetical protein ARAM_001180 [Aspergillus rambellii]|uniref:S-adenosyl-L-methionine-dependent methyltransferase n=2 Tax=Aspergillus subgen. Nidulantes TaxID=2720870 RepID=A0A0F8WNF1_9EURO|nr:hypothetical protein ARAM_001180 [Aspergillus rambellii]KKK23144.1 hypothetical protein AOCH_002290 [Aspergillus ochraceoroseus]
MATPPEEDPQELGAEDPVIDIDHNPRQLTRSSSQGYFFPNDEAESNRMDMKHEAALTMLDGKLFVSPVKTPRRILDLGTGTGIWAIDVADQHPEVEVTGIDLSPTQPLFVPPNLKFVVDDMEAEWLYTESFDLIHARYLVGALEDPAQVIAQAYKHTTPGGWFEFHEMHTKVRSPDGTHQGTHIANFFDVLRDSFAKRGRSMDSALYLEKWFRDAGFVDITVKKIQAPIGAWPKDPNLKRIGLWMYLVLDAGFEGLAMAVLTRFEQWTPEEVTVLAALARKDIKDPKIHAMFYDYLVYGRRPE